MLVVTTTWGDEQDRGEARGDLTQPDRGPPDQAGVADGLRRAAGRIDEFDARVAGAAVDWPDDWNETFDDDLIARVTETLDFS